MPEESKQVEASVPGDEKDAGKALQPSTADAADESEEEHDEPTATGDSPTTSSKKKKSKRKKLKDAIASGRGKETGESSSGGTKPEQKLSAKQFEQLLGINPALEKEMAGMPKDKVEEMMKKLTMSDLLTGMVRVESIRVIEGFSSSRRGIQQAVGGTNQKDMASYKFWQTQPVPRLGR